jgi:two-component system sensor kinase FixL
MRSVLADEKTVKPEGSHGHQRLGHQRLGHQRLHQAFRAALAIAGFALAFFLLQRLTFLLRFPPYERTTFWVPGALTFSILLIAPLKNWWWYYVGLCLAGYAAYYGDQQIPASIALLSAQFHFLAVAAGVFFIRRFADGIPFATVGSMLAFVLAAVFIVPFATSVPADLIRLYQGNPHVWPTAIRSFLSIALGMLIATPALTTLLVQFRNGWQSTNRTKVLEALALSAALLVISFWVFTKPAEGNAPSLIYAPMPFLLWAALRFEVSGASWALLVIAYLSTWNAINGRGPFSAETPDEHVLQLQVFLLAVSLPLLLVAAGAGERRRAYSRLLEEMQERRRTEERFRLVVESTPNAMLMINRSGEIVLANQQTERLFGYRQEELLGQPFERIFPERLRPEPAKSLREFFAAPALRGIGNEEELCGLRKNGSEFPLEIGLTPIESPGGLLAFAVVTDNTEKRRAEEARRELVHASRLAVLSEFTASIAHEINQPLGAILSNADAAELLLENASPPLDEVRRILADIRSDDLRASEVIRKLRGLLRRGEVERQPLDLNGVVRDVSIILRAEAQRRGVEIILKLSANPCIVWGDRVHLQQVLLNLIVNGFEAMAETRGDRRVTLSTELSGGEVIVRVSDSGAGIPAERLPKLFDRFFSTKREGMGMGLAISRSLVEEHGGRIWAESPSGSGAHFCFALPLEPPAAETQSDLLNSVESLR